MSTREALAPSPLLGQPLLTDEDAARSHDRCARPPRAHAPQALVSAVAAGRPRDPRDARRERRAEHDRLRLRRRAVRPRVFRAVHPGPVRDGVRLPGDVHARRRRHPPRLRRARAAALRARVGVVRRGRPDASRTSSRSSPSSSRSASGSPTSTSAPAWPSRSGSRSWCSRSAAGATGAGSGPCSAWPLFNGLFLVGRDPRQTARRRARQLARLHAVPVAAASTRCCCWSPRRSARR